MDPFEVFMNIFSNTCTISSQSDSYIQQNCQFKVHKIHFTDALCHRYGQYDIDNMINCTDSMMLLSE